jgi:hypothetical protein
MLRIGRAAAAVLLLCSLAMTGVLTAGPAAAVAAPTLTIENSASNIFGAGQGALFGIVVSNSTHSAAAETRPVTVTDILPAAVRLDGVIKSVGWNCSATRGSQVSCTSRPTSYSLPPGASLPILIIPLVVNVTDPLGSRITDTATADSPDAVRPVSGSATSTVVAAVGYLVAMTENVAEENGAVLPFGQEGQFGALGGGVHLHGPIVGLSVRPDGQGDWLVARDGGVFSFGSNAFYGSLGDVRLAAPIVGMAALPSMRGYWLAGTDGGVFAFGAARYLGGLADVRLAAPIVGMAATPDGKGYWLVGADGGVFAFGAARYLGGLAGVRLAAPIVGMAATPDGKGYWLVGADGGVFSFGDAKYFGSLPGTHQPPGASVTALAPVPDGLGYWVLQADGTVSRFGAAPFYGSAAPRQLDGYETVAIQP